jgi:glucose-1-phosphate thymidylyltransferase
MIDRLCRKLDDVPGLDERPRVTNAKFAPAFAEWAGSARRQAGAVHDDGTTSNDDRLGAIGDIQLVVDRAAARGDDLLVVAGDNLFDYALRDYVDWWHGKRRRARSPSTTSRSELATQYAVVESRPTTTASSPSSRSRPSRRRRLAATAHYLTTASTCRCCARTSTRATRPDAPGNFLAWLHAARPCTRTASAASGMDIGDHAQLLEADNSLRRRAGLTSGPSTVSTRNRHRGVRFRA